MSLFDWFHRKKSEPQPRSSVLMGTPRIVDQASAQQVANLDVTRRQHALPVLQCDFHRSPPHLVERLVVVEGLPGRVQYYVFCLN